jgi:Ca-activated chloride channel homolog
MTFAEPLWIVVGTAACLAGAGILRLLKNQRKAHLGRFVGKDLLGSLTTAVSTTRRRLKDLLLLAAVFLLFTALARPQWDYQWVEVKRRGIDLLFALDTSRSMLAEDIRPNRLERARLAILDFTQQLDGDRVGLVPFAGSAFLLCPLTLDYEAFADTLQAVNTEIIPVGGTNIAAVIDQAVKILDDAANHKILIILSDGENLRGEAIHAAEQAADEGLTIHTLGIGSREGELIPLPGGGGFVQDPQGNFVTSRLDEAMLARIAAAGGGISLPLGDSGEGLEAIYREKLALIPKEELTERQKKVPMERFVWPIALALFLLSGEFLLGERRNKARPVGRGLRQLRQLFRRKGIAALALLALLATADRAIAGADEAYRQGDYDTAAQYYQKKLRKSPDDPVLLYNFGTTAHRLGRYDQAIDSFSKALPQGDPLLQSKAYANRGNSQFRKGAALLPGNPAAAAELWEEALASLEAANALNPGDEAAAANRELVQQRLETLREQLKEASAERNQQNRQNRNEQQEQQDQNDRQGQQNQENQHSSGHKGNQPESGDRPSATEQGKRATAGDSQQEKDNQEDTPAAQPSPQPPGTAPVPQSETTANTAAPDGEGQGEPAPRAAANQAYHHDGEEDRLLLGMSREEAQQLLRALKNEEGDLNWLPAGGQTTGKNLDRDW